MKKKAKISIILCIALISMSSLYILHAQFATLFQQDTRSLEKQLKIIAEKVNAIKDKTTKKSLAILASAAEFLKTPEVIACKKFGACSPRAKWLIRSIEAALIVVGIAGVAWYKKGKKGKILPLEGYFDVEMMEKELVLLDSNIEELKDGIVDRDENKIRSNVKTVWLNLSMLPIIHDIYYEIKGIKYLKKEMDKPEENFVSIARQIADKATRIAVQIKMIIEDKKEYKETEEYLEGLEEE